MRHFEIPMINSHDTVSEVVLTISRVQSEQKTKRMIEEMFSILDHLVKHVFASSYLSKNRTVYITMRC